MQGYREEFNMFQLKGDKKIYIITNRKLIREGSIYDAIERCAKMGADGVILREKDLDYKELKEIVLGVRNITQKYNIPLIVNGNIDVAMDIKADGFHSSFQAFKNIAEKMDVENRIKRKESKFIFGVSIHKLEEALEAEKLGADYLIAGNIFETDCKPGLEGKGMEFLSIICSSVSIPVIAIGGINIDNIKNVLASGAYGAAVMSYAMKI
ncbi:thiamine phosphate synthase [Clostridium sp. OS1-26]|uniref:thiamine phosphate synthase n=1 Tax=Clostridium sp. OS1-26 TaxID=3070681 RepID=UPI0027DF83D7|nr:thiamine phosphate synthase [Clostridium sp. OS1-26]WML33749.1 thiamine phosphate synthase [Clostridium sp. OS1-26]